MSISRSNYFIFCNYSFWLCYWSNTI